MAIARIELRTGANLDALQRALTEAGIPEGSIDQLDAAVVAPFRPSGSGPERDSLDQLIIQLRLPISSAPTDPAVLADDELIALFGAISSLVQANSVAAPVKASGRALDQHGIELIRVQLIDEMQTDGLNRDRLILLETNIDDINPQFIEIAIERLFSAGALDVWTSTIAMKKGRAAISLHALATPELRETFVGLMIENTTTLGVRVMEVDRLSVPRLFETTTTRWGDVRIKLKVWHGRVLDIAPEYDDCATIARVQDVSVGEVWSEARNLGQVFIGRRVSTNERPTLQLLDPLGARPERD